MRVGIISNWCNRGQAVVSRYIRLIFEQAGHETFVLARPTNPTSPSGSYIEEEDAVWQVPNLTHGSAFDMPKQEYVAWARAAGVEVVFCDMNMQFKELAAVRDLGVRTIGRFVWERFAAGHAEKAKRGYEIIYSLHRGEQRRYREEYGIESPLVRFGCFPDIAGPTAPKRAGAVFFIFHGGLQGPRKPIEKTLEAFRRVKNPDIRLIIKSQAVREDSEEVDFGGDPRIEHIVQDMPYDEYHALFSSCHVCLAPSRWEGLGVHLYEAICYGMPTISNDIAPINEVIVHGKSGLLVKSVRSGQRPNGLAVYDPDVVHLAECIAELADPARVRALEETTRAERARLTWEHTRRDYLALAHEGGTGL